LDFAWACGSVGPRARLHFAFRIGSVGPRARGPGDYAGGGGRGGQRTQIRHLPGKPPLCPTISPLPAHAPFVKQILMVHQGLRVPDRVGKHTMLGKAIKDAATRAATPTDTNRISISVNYFTHCANDANCMNHQDHIKHTHTPQRIP